MQEAYVERRGFRYDRRWVVTDNDGHFHSQRDIPALATFGATPTTNGLLLQRGESSIEVAIPDARPREVTVWRSIVEAQDAGDEVAKWLSDHLDLPVRLCHMPESSHREVNAEHNAGNDIVSFADGYPILLANEASLADLNRRMDAPIPMTRFRPNIVVSDAEAWDEDNWPFFEIAGISFRNPKPCARCLVTTLNPENGESMGPEPLKTLATFRLIDGKVMFAANLIPDGEGPIRVGDILTA